MNSTAMKKQRSCKEEKSEGSPELPTVNRLAAAGNADDSRQPDEGFLDALSALPDFLLPRRSSEKPSRIPLCALLSGPPQSGKTSLLLQLALNLAVDAQSRVVFLCKPRNFQNDCLCLSSGGDVASEVSDRVQIKYVNSEEELCKYFAAFHLHPELPTAVIVDDFVDYFGNSFDLRLNKFQSDATGEVSLVKCLSIAYNAISYANAKAVPGMQHRLIISDTHHADGPRLLYIFKRFMSQVYVITSLDDPSKFCLELQHIETGGIGNAVGRFTLAHQVLCFDGLAAPSFADEE